MFLPNLVVGPVIIALIFGFIVGSRIHLKLKNSFTFTAGGIIGLLIIAVIISNTAEETNREGDYLKDIDDIIEGALLEEAG